MKWYSNYLQILKSSSTIAEEEAGVIYRLAFNALIKYGIAKKEDSGWVIEDDGLIYSINVQDSEEENLINLENLNKGSENEMIDTSQLPEINFESIKDSVDEKEVIPVFEMGDVSDNTTSSTEGDLSTSEEDSYLSLVEESNTNDSDADGITEDSFPLLEEVHPEIAEDPFASNNEFGQSELEEDNPFSSVVPNGSPFDIPSLEEDSPFIEEANSFEPPQEEWSQDPIEEEQNFDEKEEVFVAPELLPQTFPLSLNSKDFTFVVSGIKSKDLSQQATFLIAPLRTDIQTPVSVVKALINGNEFVYTTDDNGKIEFETEEYTYSIESIMEDGKFIPNVYVKDEDMNEFDTEQKSFGEKGHIALVDEEDDITVHIFPTSFKSNEHGTADFIYCIDMGDGEFFTDTNNKEKSAFVKINGEEFAITAKWKDHVLYAKIDPA